MDNGNNSLSAFTTTCPGIASRLMNQPSIHYGDSQITVDALWDTGATCTAISEKVVKELSLIPVGKKTIQTPSGRDIVNTYLVNILLPNNVIVSNVEVCDSRIGDQGIDLLIGMNIITMGDFAVTNCRGQTVFTFRMPACERLDFVKKINTQNLVGTHGGSKKRKKKK